MMMILVILMIDGETHLEQVVQKDFELPDVIRGK